MMKANSLVSEAVTFVHLMVNVFRKSFLGYFSNVNVIISQKLVYQ